MHRRPLSGLLNFNRSKRKHYRFLAVRLRSMSANTRLRSIWENGSTCSPPLLLAPEGACGSTCRSISHLLLFLCLFPLPLAFVRERRTCFPQALQIKHFCFILPHRPNWHNAVAVEKLSEGEKKKQNRSLIADCRAPWSPTYPKSGFVLNRVLNIGGAKKGAGHRLRHRPTSLKPSVHISRSKVWTKTIASCRCGDLCTTRKRNSSAFQLSFYRHGNLA